MGASEQGLQRMAGEPRAPGGAPPDRGADARPATTTGFGRIALAALVGLLIGGAAGHYLASSQFNEQLVALAQAHDLRLAAANQRVEALQQQQRDFARQVDQHQQEIVAQADEQQRKIVRQVSEQERAMLAQQRSLMDQAKERERDLAKPDLPVKVWARKTLAGHGLVAQLHNFGTKELVLAVSIPAGANNPASVWHTIIAPNATQVVGPDAGWSFAPGDELALAADGFRPLNFTVRANPKLPNKSP
jgi:hypothetical protein